MPKILRVKSKLEYGEQFKHIKAPLLKPPFLLVFNGSVRTGKSTILMNMIYNDNFYKDLFDKVIFISPTVHNDLTLKHCAEDEDIMKVDEDLENLDEIEYVENDEEEE